VRTVVVDEVDNMMEDPYYGEIMTLLEATPFVSMNTASRMEDTIDGDLKVEEHDDYADGGEGVVEEEVIHASTGSGTIDRTR
jgi:hypothetical protein